MCWGICVVWYRLCFAAARDRTDLVLDIHRGRLAHPEWDLVRGRFYALRGLSQGAFLIVTVMCSRAFIEHDCRLRMSSRRCCRSLLRLLEWPGLVLIIATIFALLHFTGTGAIVANLCSLFDVTAISVEALAMVHFDCDCSGAFAFLTGFHSITHSPPTVFLATSSGIRMPWQFGPLLPIFMI